MKGSSRQEGRRPVAPESGCVDVWTVDLDRAAASVNRLTGTLSSDERARAARFRFDCDRRRFTCARGALRCVLSEYVGARPADLSFDYGANGKPALAGACADAVSFNLSHSDDLTLIAVAPPDISVGVDIERVRALPDLDDIMRQFCARSEVTRLMDMPPELRDRGFFACWTSREAWLKAVGVGLAASPEQCEVTFGASGGERLHVKGDPDPSRWVLSALTPSAEHMAALVTSQPVTIRCRTWTGDCDVRRPVVP